MVTVTLPDNEDNSKSKEYKLHFGIKELAMIEKFHGCNLSTLASKERFGIDSLITSLWAGMTRLQPEFLEPENREDVLMLLDYYQSHGGDVALVRKAVMEALVVGGAMGKKKGEEEPPTSSPQISAQANS
jgi:hypothetical protein